MTTQGAPRDDELASVRAELAAKKAVLQRIRDHARLLMGDKRMRIAGELLLRDIDRWEKEEDEKAGLARSGSR